MAGKVLSGKMRNQELNKEVQFLRESIIKVDDDMIIDMKKKAGNNPSGKLRYCFHKDENAGMQEMLFVMPRAGYARPHMHKDVAESHVIIEGEGICVLFTASGDVVEGFKISPEDKLLYRIQEGIYHMVIPVSEQMVIYEVREGKFDSGTNIFPDWAPREDEVDNIKRFRQNLLEKIGGGR